VNRATDPLVESRHVTRRFGDFVAVDAVDVAVGAGEVVGLLGANGAGKTTLIRLLLGLLHPSEGTVALFGEPPSRRTRRRIGYVPQSLGLYDDLTAEENLAFGRAVFGEGVEELPEELHPLGDVLVGRLPLGIQRRVAFAEALGHEPDLLVLDEPTSGVDPLARARLWETVRKAADAGAGVLVTTHHMEEAEECDRLVVMAAGVVVAEGTSAEITGNATVTVVESEAWEECFDRLDQAAVAGVALVGRTLRIPGASPGQVQRTLDGVPAQVREAPATLEERFFELVSETDAGARPGRAGSPG
jgi:ABC-2 type transport system ATP-binding protein